MSSGRLDHLKMRSRGHWRGILSSLGVSQVFLTGKNGPCPMCGGKDRWRFTDWQNMGGWVCNACGRGDGFDLLAGVHSIEMAEVFRRVDGIVGSVEPDQLPKRKTAGRALQDIQRLIGMCRDMAGSPVELYLRNRSICLPRWPATLGYVERLPYDRDRASPGMVAAVTGTDGGIVQAHRTWITQDGCKADFDPPRKLMAGALPAGSAIRLFRPAEEMGVAEGIETALSAMILFRMPVWAVISAANMVRWRPPKLVKRLWIYGDPDRSFAGQMAAYTAAHDILRDCRKVGRDIEIGVRFAEEIGTDFNDQLRVNPKEMAA